jgi:hypothetical protein
MRKGTQEKGFFSEIKTQVIGVITLILTTGGTLVATHMEKFFGTDKASAKTEVAAPVAGKESSKVKTKTIIIKEKKSSKVEAAPKAEAAPKPKKTETEKRKEEGLDW